MSPDPGRGAGPLFWVVVICTLTYCTVATAVLGRWPLSAVFAAVLALGCWQLADEVRLRRRGRGPRR